MTWSAQEELDKLRLKAARAAYKTPKHLESFHKLCLTHGLRRNTWFTKPEEAWEGRFEEEDVDFTVWLNSEDEKEGWRVFINPGTQFSGVGLAELDALLIGLRIELG